ncbi:MAG TPA: ribosome maturation factor RimP [Actinomycetaceae bacterium]|nr:ribosome maturation factor RimP [Actinomycetaceae bacterium]
MSRPSRARIREALEPAVSEAGLYLEDVTVTGGRRALLRVTVDLPDGPGGVSTDQLGDVSARISAALDELDPLSGAYTLEVSTPGTNRPLVDNRHYRRAIGHLVRLQTTGGPVRGRLTEVTDEEITIAEAKGERVVKLDSITSARVEPELGRSAQG